MEEKQVLKGLAALAQPTRLAVFRALVKCGPAGLHAGLIAERFNVPASTLSFHLKELVQAGLVQGTRQSQQVFYSVDFASMRALMAFLAEDCCREHPDSCEGSEPTA